MVGLNTKVNWLVCYDIADRKRLVRVFKLLKSNGIPIQYSVFLVRASPAEMERLEQKITRLIDPRADDVRAYRIADREPKIEIGPPLLIDGTLIGCGLQSL